MATSSERSPPPFPESEDQEPDPDAADGDSDEGEDIFTGNVSNPDLLRFFFFYTWCGGK